MDRGGASGPVDVVQDGARLHYALPLALQRAGLLGRVFTDWFVREGSFESLASRLATRLSPGVGARLAERSCRELEPDRVVTHLGMALRHAAGARFHASASEAFAAEAEANARRIVKAGLPANGALMGFARNLHPSLARAAAQAHGRLVVDQMIAPAVAEAQALTRAARLWPRFAAAGSFREDPVMRRMEEEAWPHAARVTCPSLFVRDALMAAGLPASRLFLAPYPIDASRWSAPDRAGREGPPVVGFVGAVGLRKGAPVFAEIARRLGRAARFVMVGPVADETTARALAAAGVELAGPVPRGAIEARLSDFDLYLFPSFCEGSAGSVMEAMAAGLPIVTTPSAGAVARHGIEGFVHDCEDIEGLADGVARLVGDEGLRLRMGSAARARALAFGLDRYAADLSGLFAEIGTVSAQRPRDGAEKGAVDQPAPA